jgi:hypothetical protein
MCEIEWCRWSEGRGMKLCMYVCYVGKKKRRFMKTEKRKCVFNRLFLFYLSYFFPAILRAF